MTDNESNPPGLKRRWYQYSLRTLFVLTAIVAAVFAYHKVRTRRYEAQQRAIGAIHTMGARAEVEHKPPRWWQRLLGPAHYTIDTARVDFVFPDVTVRADDLPRQYVDQVRSAFEEKGQVPPSPLFGEPLGDAKLAALAACLRDVPDVKQVVLTCTVFASSKWPLFSETEIESYVHFLKLDPDPDTQITDQGLRHLSALTEVEVLVLQGSHISDEGLKHLEGLKNLRKLWLVCPQVTAEGVENLQRALPNCTIQR